MNLKGKYPGALLSVRALSLPLAKLRSRRPCLLPCLRQLPTKRTPASAMRYVWTLLRARGSARMQARPRILTAQGICVQELRKKLEYDITQNQFMVTGTLTRSLYAEVGSCCIAEALLFCHVPCSCLQLSPPRTRASAHNPEEGCL